MPSVRVRLGVAFGARLARAEVETVLGGRRVLERCSVYFGDAEQHIDHRSIQDHGIPDLERLYKGVMRDASNAIYKHGLIEKGGAPPRRLSDQPQHPVLRARLEALQPRTSRS